MGIMLDVEAARVPELEDASGRGRVAYQDFCGAVGVSGTSWRATTHTVPHSFGAADFATLALVLPMLQ